MAFCVNKNSLEFKKLKQDLYELFDDLVLDNLIYDYLNSNASQEYAREHNGEPRFPDKYEIIALANGMSENFATDKEIRLWANKYSRRDAINKSTKNGFYGIRLFHSDRALDEEIVNIKKDGLSCNSYTNSGILSVTRPLIKNSELLMYLLDKLNIVHHNEGKYYLTKRIYDDNKKRIPDINSKEDTIGQFFEKLRMLNINSSVFRLVELDDSIEVYTAGEYLDYNSNTFVNRVIKEISLRRNNQNDIVLYTSDKLLNQSPIEKEMKSIKEKALADGTFMKAPNGKDTNLTERQWLQVRTKAFINWFGDWINDPANASKVVDENGEPLVVIHSNKGYYEDPISDLNTFELDSKDDRYQVGLSYADFNKLSNNRKARLLSQNYASFTKDYIILTQTEHRLLKDREDNLNHAKKDIAFRGLSSLIDVDLNILKVYNPHQFVNNIIETDENPEEDNNSKYEGIATTYFTTKKQLKYSSLYGETTGEFFLNIRTPFNAENASKDSREKYLRHNDFGTGNIKRKRLMQDGYDGATDYLSHRPEYVAFTPNQIKSATDNIGVFSPENDEIYFQKKIDITELIQKLKSYKPKNVYKEDAMRRDLLALGIDPEIIAVIRHAIDEDSSLKGKHPYDIFRAVMSMSDNDIASQYNRYVEKPVMDALELHLRQYISKYNISIEEGGLVDRYGVLGAFDIINKIISVSKNRNSITLTEEVAHAIVELMGSKEPLYDKSGNVRWSKVAEENKDFAFLYDNVVKTSIYKQVYLLYKDVYKKEDGTPDEYKIRKEVIGLALAVAINQRWENKQEEQERSFWEKLRQWIESILLRFSKLEYIDFESLTNKIADEVINNDYSRLNKVDSSNYSVLDYTETIIQQNKKDDGKALGFMKYFTSKGNIITGSLSYRRQGEVYRGGLDALHDIDMIIPYESHKVDFESDEFKQKLKESVYHPGQTGETQLTKWLKNIDYFKSIFEKYPKMKIGASYYSGGFLTINAVYSENESLSEKFNNLTGSYASRLDKFTDEERSQIYLFDFFFKDKNDNTPYIVDNENGLKLARFDVSFEEKLKMGRAKDIFDYLMWKKFDEFKSINPTSMENMLFQIPQNKKISISQTGYKKLDVADDKTTARVFTDNAQAYVTAQGLDDSWIQEEFNKGDKVKTGVSDVNGTNQAGIRAYTQNTYGRENINPYAFGIVTKKYQQKLSQNRFLEKEGLFSDTEEDFELFKSLNNHMFDRLETSNLENIMFPPKIALGKSALPLRFAQWLRDQLLERFEISSTIEENLNDDYLGYGLNLDNSAKLFDQKQTISKKTETFGVQVTSGSEDFWKKQKEWQDNHPNGILAYRKHGDDPRSFSVETVKSGWIGNPFSTEKRDYVTVLKFYDWLVTGNNFGELRATELLRLAIIQKILDSPKDTNILYYKELNKPSHATVIGYLINNKQLLLLPNLKNAQQQSTENQEEVSNTGAHDTIDDLKKYQQEANDTIEFEKSSHTYYINGAKVDYSVTEYKDEVYGKPDIYGNYSHSQEIGNAVDAVTRDFFLEGEDYVRNTKYLNLNDNRKESLINDLNRLKQQFDKEFHKNYHVITSKFILAGSINVDGLKKTIAGTVDMLIIDGAGNVHILDMKAKHHKINETDRRDYTFQLNAYRQLLEAQFPYLKGRIKDLRLIWFDTEYPKQVKEATFVTDKKGRIFVSDNDVANMPIENYDKWKTPKLEEKTDDSFVGNSLIPLNVEDKLDDVLPLLNQRSERKTQNELPINLTSFEIKLIQLRRRLMESNIMTGAQVNDYAKIFTFYLSKMISDLQESTDNNQMYFSEENTFYDYDFTNMTRIDILRTIGSLNMFNTIKEKYFNMENNPNAEYMPEDIYNRSKAKLDLLYLNFDAFVEMALSSLCDLEQTSFDGARVVNDGSSQVFEDQDSAIEAAEIFGSSLETWQIGFRQISAINSLSQIIKRSLSYITKKDSEGYEELTDEGLPIMESLTDITTSILAWTQGAEDIIQMIEMLENHIDDATWVQDVVDMLRNGDETYRSQFFSNFCKYFLPYAILYYDSKEKRMVQKIINKSSTSDMLYEDFLANIQYIIDQHITSGTESPIPLYRWDNKTLQVSINSVREGEFDAAFGILFNYRNRADAYDEDLMREVLDAIKKIMLLLGVDVDENKIEAITSDYQEEKASDEFIKLFKNIKGIKEKKLQPGRGDLKKLFDAVGIDMGASAESVSYEAGKLHYSYVTPSWLSLFMNDLRGINTNEEDYKHLLENEFGNYKWFCNRNAEGTLYSFRNYWLRLLYENPELRKELEHAVVLSSKEKGAKEEVGYTDKSPLSYTRSMLQAYFYADEKNKPSRFAYFRIPIMSNKPSEEYIRFTKITGANYKDKIISELMNVAHQEIDRMATVKVRRNNRENNPTIESFDDRGDKFLFLDFLLKSYESDENFKALVDEYINSLIKDTGSPIVSDLDIELRKLIGQGMLEKFDQFRLYLLEENIISEREDSDYYNYENLKGLKIGSSNEEIENNLENFFWNDALASINILQLTITDKAFYKNDEDLLKRLAQIHAPGLRGNLAVLDDLGNDIFDRDRKMRTLYLADFSDVVSDAIDNVAAIFDNQYQNLVKAGKLSLAEKYKNMTDSILEEFKKINVTDAQGYTSLTGYRKKAKAFGRWNDDLEQMYLDVKSNKYQYKRNINATTQPGKPFVFTLIMKHSDGILDNLRVGHQNKNSEYLLFMMDAIIQNDQTGIAANCKLKAISEIMEESAGGRWDGDVFVAGTTGIDTIQFESTVKTGLQGAVNINDDAIKEYRAAHEDDSELLLSDTEIVKEILREAMYNEDGSYNQNVVHEYRAKDYSYQSEVPAHLEGESIMGSQLRMLIISDLDIFDENGHIRTINIDGKEMTITDARKIYMDAIVDNIKRSADLLREELGLYHLDRKSRNIALSRLLLDEIRKDSRYGYDLLFSVCTDEDGNFNMPLSDPIQSARIQLLLNSLIKKHVNKQEIEGGPAVQVSNFGTAKKLNIVFKDKNGNILMTRKEWESSENKEEKTFDDYIKKNQGAIAYFECYAPSTIFREFADENGYIDINKVPKEMLEMIGYRIPTEAKYSMAPLKIVGFLPYEAGEGIMLPYEITLLSGSDFDIDKLYLIRRSMKLDYEKALSEFKQDRKEFWNEFYEKMPGSKEAINAAKEEFDKRGDKDGLHQYILDYVDRYVEQYGDLIQMLKDGKVITFREWLDDKMRSGDHGSYYGRNTSRKGVNDNIIFSTIWGVLTDIQSAEQIMHPGNFDEPKKYGYISAILDKRVLKPTEDGSVEYYKYEDLIDLSPKQLKKIVDDNKNIVFILDHIAFHKLNMVAGKLIGIFAQNNVSHSIISLEPNTTIYIDNNNHIKINGLNLGGREEAYDRTYNRNGDRISSVLALFLAASVDAVKDPVLNYMNINETTAGVVTTMARLGFDIETIMLLLTLPIVKQVVNLYNMKTEGGRYASMNDVIDEVADEHGLISEDSNSFKQETDEIAVRELTKSILIKSRQDSKLEDETQILMAFQRLYDISRATSDIGNLTRFNSIAAAVGPKISDTLILKDKLFRARSNLMLQTESMKMALSNPVIAEFLNQSFRLFHEVFEDNFLLASDYFENIFTYVSENIRGNLDESSTNKLMEFYMAYISNLHEDPLDGEIKARSMFGSKIFSSEERDYIMNKFVPTVKLLKKEFSGNPFVDRIQIKSPDRRHTRLWINVNTRGMELMEVDKLKLAWYDLYKSGEKGKKFALDLAKYEFFVNGFGFSPLTFSNLMPIQLKMRIENYVENLRDSSGNIGDDDDRQIFYDLFFRNNHNDTKFVPVVKKAYKNNDGKIVIPKSNKSIIIADGIGGWDVVTYLKFEDQLYKLNQIINKGDEVKVIYEPIEPLGGPNNEFLEINPGYNIKKSTVEVKKPEKEEKEQGKSNDNKIKDNPRKNVIGAKHLFGTERFNTYEEALAHYSNLYKDIAGTKLASSVVKTIENEIFNSLIDLANKMAKGDWKKSAGITRSMVNKIIKELNLC